MRNMKLIDIAVNLTDPVFRGCYRGKQVHVDDLEQVLSRSIHAGIDKIMITGTNLDDSLEAIQLAHTKECLFATVGCHPTRCQEFLTKFSDSSDPAETYYSKLRALISENTYPKGRVVAVGECGLDYDRLEFCPREIQLEFFKQQFKFADEFKLPMFLHSRSTNGDFVKMVREHRHQFTTGVVHSFDGSLEEMNELTNELNLFIGINGCSLKTKENLDVVKEIPLDRLMLETDAPWCDIRPTHASSQYLTATDSTWTEPETKKKERFELGLMVKGRNEPCMIRNVLRVVANLKNVSEVEVANAVYQNTKKVFFPHE